MENSESQVEGPRQFRAEAAIVMGLDDPPMPQAKEVRPSKDAGSRD
jgi:hypothetical protein